MVVPSSVKQGLPVAVFSAIAFFRFGFPVFVMLSTAVFLARPLFQFRQWIFLATSIICLFFGFGVLNRRLLVSLQELYPSATLSYSAIRPQIFAAALLVAMVGYFMNRRLQNFRLRFLIAVIALTYFSVGWLDQNGSVALGIFGHCLLFFLFKQSWYFLSETHPGVLSTQYPAVTMFQYWNLGYGTIIPFPVITNSDVSIEALERTQWRGVRMFVYTVILHIGYRALIALASNEPLPIRIASYSELYAGPGFEGARLLAHRVGGYPGLFLGILYSGVGVIIFVALMSGYQVAILRMFGYDVPSNTTKKVLHFLDFNSFLKSAYWYYSYLVSRVIVPRVRSAVKTYGGRFGQTHQLRLTIFGSILITGLLFQLSAGVGLSDSSYNHVYTLQGAAWALLFYILMASVILVTFHEKKRFRRNQISSWRLVIRRILIVILFFFLIVPKALFSRIGYSPLEIKSYFIGDER